MTFEKIITVYGATGSQGGPVVRSLLKNRVFKVRAITRNPESLAAQDLRALGAEIVEGDGWKKEQMMAAFMGSWGAFVNTNSDDPCLAGDGCPTEFDLGKTIIDGIIATGTVKHLVYSSFVDTSDFTKGQVIVRPAEMKAKIQRYAEDSGYFETVCPLYQGWYMDIFSRRDYAQALGGFPFFQDDQGFRTLRSAKWGSNADMPVPWISLKDDYGDIVHGIFLEPESWNGRIVPTVSDISTYPGVTETFQSVTGQRARYVHANDWRALFGDSRQGEENRSIFEFGRFTNGKYFGDHPISTDKSAYLKARAVEAQGGDPREEKLITLSQWFAKNHASEIRGNEA
ncbi:NmrA/HSCARG family protein [Aspergillus affinis]|uniref:NmrA/HSCARG family protein n=1 Tax=Aspergillus affinis TaxID=1070780 RepID=UPI0022FF0EB9|nr:NmrA family protein [Aspergillus affinis]KAI9043893.1 NmrA family protein [Aspergillus affinis]